MNLKHIVRYCGVVTIPNSYTSVLVGVSNSDHASIEVDFKVKISKRRCTSRLVYDFKAADWCGLKEDLANIPWNCVDLSVNIEDNWNSWKTLLLQAVNRNDPSKFVSSKQNVPWFNSNLKNTDS